MPALHPEVLWAQRSSETEEAKNILYITINLPDIIESSLEYDLTPTSISFKAKTGNAEKGIDEKDYAFQLDFYGEVVPEESLRRLTSRSLVLHLRNKEKKAEYWPRLQKAKIKSNFLKTDFSKWVDEDEQDGEKPIADDGMDMEGMGGPGMSGMGMPGMGGLGGGGGMGDMDIQKLMAQMGDAGAGGSGFGSSDPTLGAEEDSDDEGPPPLENA